MNPIEKRTGISFNRARELAQNREKWRKLAHNVQLIFNMQPENDKDRISIMCWVKINPLLIVQILSTNHDQSIRETFAYFVWLTLERPHVFVTNKNVNLSFDRLNNKFYFEVSFCSLKNYL